MKAYQQKSACPSCGSLDKNVGFETTPALGVSVVCNKCQNTRIVLLEDCEQVLGTNDPIQKGVNQFIKLARGY